MAEKAPGLFRGYRCLLGWHSGIRSSAKELNGPELLRVVTRNRRGFLPIRIAIATGRILCRNGDHDPGAWEKWVFEKSPGLKEALEKLTELPAESEEEEANGAESAEALGSEPFSRITAAVEKCYGDLVSAHPELVQCLTPYGSDGGARGGGWKFAAECARTNLLDLMQGFEDALREFTGTLEMSQRKQLRMLAGGLAAIAVS